MEPDSIEHTGERLGHYSLIAELLYTLLFPGEHVESPMLKRVLEGIPAGKLDKLREEARGYRGSNYLTRLPRAVLESYPQLLERFYLNYGFTIHKVPPDHLLAEVAFMGKIVSIELQLRAHGALNDALDMLRVESRFMNSHLKPLVLALREGSTLFRETLGFIADFILEDAYYIYHTLTAGVQTPSEKARRPLTPRA